MVISFLFIFFNNASMKGGKNLLSNSPKFQLSKGKQEAYSGSSKVLFCDLISKNIGN